MSEKLQQFNDIDDGEMFPAATPKPSTKQTNQADEDTDSLYDPAAMAVKISDTPTAGAVAVVKLPNRITVDKPSKQAYFRHSPEFYIQTYLIHHEATRGYYYPSTGEVRDALSEFVKVVDLFGIVTLLGDFRFWPVNVLEMDNEWNESARDIIADSVDSWVGYRSLEGRYQRRDPLEDHPDPVWPEATMRELLTRAFRGTHTIKDLNHKVVKALLGGGVKK